MFCARAWDWHETYCTARLLAPSSRGRCNCHVVAKEASRETDSRKLAELADELVRAFEERDRKLRLSSVPSANSPGLLDRNPHNVLLDDGEIQP